ncbi:MAG: cytochrome b5 domain-containing protein [Candidatus Paceibacterota bacterium]|jgi:cytochrome b involved in lipid metabolism
MTTFTKKISSLVLFAALLLSPAFVLADGGEHLNNKNGDRHPKIHGKSAFAHTHVRERGEKGDQDDDEGRGEHRTSTTTPATTLALRGLAITNVSTSSALVSWTTNVTSSSKVYFGTTSPLSLLAASSVTSATPVKSHSIGLTGLTASTTYYVVVASVSAANGSATSSQTSFTTAPLSTTNQVTLTSAVIATHNTQNSCWLTIGSNVYNITAYVPYHPGGVQAIVSLCGTDATAAFGGIGHSSSATALLANYLLGALGQTVTI